MIDDVNGIKVLFFVWPEYNYIGKGNKNSCTLSSCECDKELGSPCISKMALFEQKQRRGHRDGVIFQPLPDGRQGMRAMPSHYRDTKNKIVVEYREKFRNLVLYYHALSEALKGCFEFGIPRQTTFNRFMHNNLRNARCGIGKKEFMFNRIKLEPVCVSSGSLPPLNTRIDVDEEGLKYLVCDIGVAEWKKGDLIRFISLNVTEDATSMICIYGQYEDTEYSGQLSFRSLPLSSGAYAYVHLHHGSKGIVSSTQQMLIVE